MHEPFQKYNVVYKPYWTHDMGAVALLPRTGTLMQIVGECERNAIYAVLFDPKTNERVGAVNRDGQYILE